MGLRQQSQARNALGLELVGDEIQKSGASPFGCLGDGASEKDFVVELAGVAVVELENAVFSPTMSMGTGCVLGEVLEVRPGSGCRTEACAN